MTSSEVSSMAMDDEMSCGPRAGPGGHMTLLEIDVKARKSGLFSLAGEKEHCHDSGR